MIIPDFNREEGLYRKGYRTIAGVDEAGRGPLAGPVVAAAVVFSPEVFDFELGKRGVRDSKTLSGAKREELYEFITQKAGCWGVGIVSEKTIDKMNILQASLLAMKIAVENLKNKPDFLLLDGNHTIKNYPVSQIAAPGGDKIIISISAASIIAKVTRDRIMFDVHQKFPQYGFDRHKGYGTKLHLEKIKEHGFCEIHRKTFRPIRDMIERLRK